ncbi:MAG TPA: hypothetical protein VFU46_13530 [Gemmatimonadales bacterium]|nr:hypothetical protein [Gemmatimonadales bacterium]
MPPTLLALLRIIHILAAVFWVGAALFVAAFLMPALRAAGPAAGPVMQQLTQARRLPQWMMVATVVTLLSGAVLYWGAARVGGPAWLGSGPGQAFGLGGVLSLAAGVLATAVNAPTGKRLGALGAALATAGRPPSAEETALLQRLQRRLARAAWLGVALLVLATVAMAAARYVR